MSFLLLKKRKIPHNPERQFFPQSGPRPKIIEALFKSICPHHRTCSEEDSMLHKLLSEIWRISTSGIGNYRSERYTIWPLAAAKLKWATFLRGWRRALRFTEVPRNGHLKLVASSTELQGKRSVQLQKTLCVTLINSL